MSSSSSSSSLGGATASATNLRALKEFIGVDVLLWCAKTEERDHLEATLSQGDTMLKMDFAAKVWDKSHNVLIPGELKLSQGTANCILVAGYQQGVESCGIGLTSVLELYRPRFAVMIGMCAAIGSDLSTVVMSSAGLNFESGKVASTGDGSTEFRHDSEVHESIDGDVKQVMRSFRASNDGILLRTSEPGTMISSSSVREDFASIDKEMKTVRRDIVGLDMESSAFFNACKRCDVTALGVFKGVTDNGSSEKSDKLHKDCVQKAREICVRFIDFYFKHKSVIPDGCSLMQAGGDVSDLLHRYEGAKDDKDRATDLFSKAKDALIEEMVEGTPYQGRKAVYSLKYGPKFSYTISFSSISEIDGLNLTPDQLMTIDKHKKRLKDDAELVPEIKERKRMPRPKKSETNPAPLKVQRLGDA